MITDKELVEQIAHLLRKTHYDEVECALSIIALCEPHFRRKHREIAVEAVDERLKFRSCPCSFQAIAAIDEALATPEGEDDE